MTTSNWIHKHISTWALLVLYATFQSLLLVPAALADSKTQTITFDSWVEIPGGVLPGGRYVFRLTEASSDRHQVRIYDQVSGILVATLPTIPQQLKAPVEDTIRFAPRQSPFQGEAVVEWFRPGSRVGEEFIYAAGQPVGEATMAANTAELRPVNAPVNAEESVTLNRPSEANPTSADAVAPGSSAMQPP
jgi:hypothetical protein